IEVRTIGDKIAPDDLVLVCQLSMKQACEIAQYLFAALQPRGNKCNQTGQRGASDPFVGGRIFNNGLDPVQIAAANRREDIAEILRNEVAEKRVEKIARKQRNSDHERVGARLAKLRQQKHGIQMRHVIALSVEVARSLRIRNLFQDLKKLWDDLFPAGNRRFDCFPVQTDRQTVQVVR